MFGSGFECSVALDVCADYDARYLTIQFITSIRCEVEGGGGVLGFGMRKIELDFYFLLKENELNFVVKNEKFNTTLGK